MKVLVIAAVLVVFLQSFDCAPQRIQSSSTSTININDVAVQIINNNGYVQYTVNGRPGTEQDVQAAFGPNANIQLSPSGISVSYRRTSMTSSARSISIEDNQEFDRKMEEKRNEMANEFASMRQPAWPFNP